MSVATIIHSLKMASSELPENGLPFGYNLADDAFLRPPSPCGEPLLNLSDNNVLGDFFTGMESNQYNGLSSDEALLFSEDWLGQIPPHLLAHRTSLGNQPRADLAGAAIPRLPPTEHGDFYTFRQNTMPPPPLPARSPPGPSHLQQPIPQSQPALHHFQPQLSQSLHNQRGFHVPLEQDAHADAAALLTTLHSGHPYSYSARTTSFNNFHPSPHMQPPQAHRLSLPQAHLSHDHGDSAQPTRPNDETFFADMVFGRQGLTGQRPADPPALQWGSDALFARNQAFVPPQHESIQALEKKRMVAVNEVLKLATSTPNTRSSSPIGNRESTTHASPDNPNRNIKLEENGAATPRKRRKSKARIEGEEDGDCVVQLPSRAAAKKRKSKGDLNGSADSLSAVQETSGKRRKSAPSQPKTPRENLTDAQKRENHIKSEQKRRGAIKEGFDDLTFIVPNLQNGGYSKSSMLNIAGEWLDSLIKGNEILDSGGKRAP